jgi:tuftelin-interacting protein 11
MENLLLRSIIPKLVVGMRTFVINPANQDIATFKAVMEWGGVVANSHLLCIFLGEFFPKWLCTLSFWLQNSVPSPNLYKDIRLWYLGWKSMFPEHFLEDEDVVKYFTVALDMLEATITGKIADFQVISEYVNGYFSSKDYFYYLQSKQIVPNTYVVPEIKPLKYSSNETFKDVVEKLAADHSIDFFLTPKAHNNNQLYSFGKHLIYFDNNVIYKKIDDQSEYEPVGLQPLLAMSML